MLCSGRSFRCLRFVNQINLGREMGHAIAIFRANHPLPAVALAFDLPMGLALGNHVAHNSPDGPPAVGASLFRALDMFSRRIAKRKMPLLRILFQAAEGTGPNCGLHAGEHRKRLGEGYGLAKQRHFSFRRGLLVGLPGLWRDLSSHP